MESLKHDELFKNRGLGATLKAAYSMFLTNFQRILKHLWPAALVYAVLIPILFIVSLQVTQANEPNWWLMGVGFVLAVVASVVLYSRIAMLLNDKSWKWNTGRVLKLALWCFCIYLLVIVIMGCVWGAAWMVFAPAVTATPVDAQLMIEQQATASLKILSVVGVVGLIVGLLLVPLAYTFTKYIVDTKSKIRNLISTGYKHGLRHWGYIFATLVLTGLLLMLVTFVLCLPLMIVYLAIMLNAQGVSAGDASGLPGGFMWLVYLVSVVTYFVLAFVEVFFAFVCYYMYGTIETRQQEREAGRKMAAMKLNEEEV